MIKHFPWKRKPWRLEWRDPVSGKTRVRSFVTEDEARTFERVQAELAQKEKELLARARRRARSNIPSYTVDEVLTAYLARPDIRPNTAQANKYHARELRRLMGSRKMASLTPDDVKAFMQAQRMRGLQQSTANRRAGILRAACNWAVRENMLKVSPLSGLRLPAAPSRRISPPTIAELDRLYAAAPPHIQRIILLGLYTGARVGASELFRLRWDQVNLSSGLIYMPSAYKSRGADGRYIPVRSDLSHALERWKAQDGDSPWVISFHGKPVKRISASWRRLCRDVGITRPLRPYDLRHAFATLSIAGTGDIGSVAELMGHSNANMLLKVYQHIRMPAKKAAVESLPAMNALRSSRHRQRPPR